MAKVQKPLTVDQMDVQISQAGETAKRVLAALFDKPFGRTKQLSTTEVTRVVNEGRRGAQAKTLHQVRNALDRLLARGIVLKSAGKVGQTSSWALNLIVPDMNETLEVTAPVVQHVTRDGEGAPTGPAELSEPTFDTFKVNEQADQDGIA